MEAILTQQRILLVIAAFAVGIAVSSLIHTPFGLLAPLAALFLFASDRTGPLLHCALAIGLIGSLLAAAFFDGEARNLAAAWAAFFALAICIGALVATRSPASHSAEETPAATRDITIGEAPSYPVVGPTLHEKASPRHSPFVGISAQDDKATAAQLVAVSFWGGTQFHMRYWRRRPDGSYRWVESRSEPLREPSGTLLWSSVTADIDDQRPGQEPPARIASNPASDDGAVRAAKIVENLLGNAWAFDAAGRPTYLTPIAQTFVALTLEEFQAAVDEGHTFFKLTTDPDDYDRISAAWRHSLQTGDPFFLDRRIRRASGIHEWNRTGIVPTRDRRGRITGWYGTTIDLDAHRIAEAELRDRERELAQLVNMVPSHLWRLTPDGEPIFFSKRMVDFLGLDVADMDRPGMSRLEAMIETVHPDNATEFRDTLRRCFATGESFAMRYRLRRADGVYRWMSSNAEPMRDQDGRIVQWYGLCHDIDDQMHAEEALRRSERQLQQLVDAVPAMIWSTSPEGTPAYVNKRFTDVIGANLKDITAPDGSPALSKIIHPDDVGETLAKVRQSFGTGVPYIMRYRQIRRGGHYRWTETRAEALRDDSGEILQWYGVSVDIHDLVTAQEALRDREQELSQLVNMVPIHIRRLTPQGEPTFFNKRLIDFFGLGGVADLDKPGMSRLAAAIQTHVHPDDAADLLETARRSFAAGEPFSTKYRMRRADGAYRWVDTRAEPLRNQSGTIVQWYVISLDIDDEMRAQRALHDRERELSQLVNMVPSLLWRLNPDGEPDFFNKRTIDFLGLDAADYDTPGMSRLAATLAAVIHPVDVAGVEEGFNRSFATGEPFAMTYRLRRADGVYRWVSARAEPLRDERGHIIQWYGLAHDIDDQMRAEAAIRQSERRLQQMIDAVPVYILSFTASGEPTYVNKRYADYLGFSVPNFDSLQEQLRAIVHPDDFAEMHRTLSNCFQTGTSFLMRYRRCGKDGIYRWTEGRAEPLRDQDGTIMQWYAVSLDIEEERQAQEALRQASDKLARATQAANLAELSASIAHEVNQPLAAVVANSHACERWLAAEPPNFERAKITVERIIRDANSAADVVSRIRALFKQSVDTKASTKLPDVLAEARNLMAEEAARLRVRMDVDVEGNLPLVAFDRVQLQQVLINLIRNGMDAMDSIAGDRTLAMRARRMGAVIQTEISDCGRGVEFPDRIFEPFFTTKQNGMGMGLAICRSIVESHGGRLWVENHDPHGATFIFTLPVEVKANA